MPDLSPEAEAFLRSIYQYQPGDRAPDFRAKLAALLAEERQAEREACAQEAEGCAVTILSWDDRQHMIVSDPVMEALRAGQDYLAALKQDIKRGYDDLTESVGGPIEVSRSGSRPLPPGRS